MLKIVSKIVRKINAFSLIVILLISFVTCVIISNVLPATSGHEALGKANTSYLKTMQQNIQRRALTFRHMATNFDHVTTSH